MTNIVADLAKEENEAPKEVMVKKGNGGKCSRKGRKVQTHVLEFDFGYLSRNRRHPTGPSDPCFVWQPMSQPQPQPQSQPQSQSQSIQLTAAMFPSLK
jgi:hypothetical protein